MLVDLVISDEIDPWEIDIADIANRFLEKIREMSKINLRLSGKTLLTASILLRMKSESLIPQE
jgi:segregation and condensation protein A